MKKIISVITNKYIIFAISFLLMFLYLLSFKDLIGGSFDAQETVKVFKSFFSDNKYISYVMYKGIYAFLPGVICYNISKILGISWIILMKIFHSLAFAYITTVGIPYIYKYIFKDEIKAWQKYLFIGLLFALERNIFIFISVDFASLSILVLSINSIIRIIGKKDIKKVYYLISGLFLGICACFSGQYLPSAVILIIYIIYIIIKNNLGKKALQVLLCLLIFFSGIFITKGLNTAYNNTVVNPIREKGEWLPNGEEWFLSGFAANMLTINYPRMMPDYLGQTMIQKEKLDVETVKRGIALYDKRGVIKMIFSYPVIFCTRWLERLFLGLINDPYNSFPQVASLSPVLCVVIMASLLYVSILLLKKNTKRIKDIFNFKKLLILSFILSALTPSIGHMENRYYFGIRTLIIGAFCLSKIIPDMLNAIRNFFKNYNLNNIKSCKINYNLVVFFIFVGVVLVYYVTLYQSAGPNINMTYEIF